MLIVDAQVHIWTSGTPVHIHRQTSSYTQDELLRDMDTAGVTGAVLHPPSWDVNANEVAIAAAKQHPNRLSVLGFFDVAKPESRALIDTWKNQPGMLGLRFAFLKPGEENRMVDGTLDWLWPAAEKAGLPIGLLVPNRCAAVATVAAKYPNLKILVDHMARPRFSVDDAGFSDLPELLALAKFPNVAVKATGGPSYSTHVYPYRNIHSYIKQIFDAFGPERLFWGTDITRMPCTYRQSVTMFTEEMPWLPREDLAWVLGKGVRAWLGWV